MDLDVERQSSGTFNMGLSTLERFDIHLRQLSRVTIFRKIGLMKSIIHELYKELRPFLKETEKTEGDAFIKKIKSYSFYEGDHPNNIKADRSLAENIELFDYWIRDKMRSHKLLMSMSDDPTQSLGR